MSSFVFIAQTMWKMDFESSPLDPRWRLWKHLIIFS